MKKEKSGLHVTLAPDECQAHADALVIGEAEEAWPRLLRDFQAGRLQPCYDLLDIKRCKVWNIRATERFGVHPT